MSADNLAAIRDSIQQDVGRRGLATDSVSNLLTACPNDFAAACQSIAATPNASLAVVTGFFIPHGQPPSGETDGPLGALFLARALRPLGIRVALVTDQFCSAALHAGLEDCDLQGIVPQITLPPPKFDWEAFLANDWLPLLRVGMQATHLIALERVGPSHTPLSIKQQGGAPELLVDFVHEVPREHQNRCHTARGIDITDLVSPAHLLFEAVADQKSITTIGIGDGGNEIGMGKIPWDVIRRNIPGGAKVACRVATDDLIVAGVSNWGAYGLAAGIWALRGQRPPPEFFDVEHERRLLQIMVDRGPLVDGVTGLPTATVDGLTFEQYAEPLRQLGSLP